MNDPIPPRRVLRQFAGRPAAAFPGHRDGDSLVADLHRRRFLEVDRVACSVEREGHALRGVDGVIQERLVPFRECFEGNQDEKGPGAVRNAVLLLLGGFTIVESSCGTHLTHVEAVFPTAPQIQYKGRCRYYRQSGGFTIEVSWACCAMASLGFRGTSMLNMGAILRRYVAYSLRARRKESRLISKALASGTELRSVNRLVVDGVTTYEAL